MFVNLVPDHVIVHRMFPLAADRTVVECDWLFLPERGGDRHGRQPRRWSCSTGSTSRTSRPASAASRPWAHGVYRDGGVLVPSEHHIGAFHDWVQDRIAH